ncbi:class I SAM-dependent methyltransferase [Patescibacteria group bacterium]|nr:class I SAM-dependent methyltransferase [Patescibacteria group bacterium]
MDTRIDIGTGNGIVSNMVAFPIVSQRASARLDREIKALRNKELDDLPDESHKPHFIACDLSKASLSLAEDLAKDHFHDLEKLFTLEYYQGTFQKLLAENNDEKPRLITMFNVLANFEYDDLKKILQDVADAMKP